jgi:dTDP-glucose 4,6-dehydratase
MALRVGYDKLHGETGWVPTVTWEEGLRRTIAWYAANRDRWVGRVDWMQGDARDRSGAAAAASAPAG